jgi:hypothetical protein
MSEGLSPFNIQMKKSVSSSHSHHKRDSDVYIDSYSPIPASSSAKDEDPDSMFSPSRPNESTLPWPFNLSRHQYHRHRRLVDRDGQFHQSHGKLSIRKKIKIKEWRNLYGTDWFHSLVNSPTWRMILVLLSLYVLMILIFAFPYYWVGGYDNDMCNMGVKNYHEAFNFSLETMATIGYSTKDIFFGDCIIVSMLLTLQICTKIILDALTIGVIYSRLARPTTRASTIIMSNNAVIRRIRGKLFLMFQVCELRKHQLVEAHARLYLLKNELDIYREENLDQNGVPLQSSIDQDMQGSRYFQTYPLRIAQPSDERGAMLLLCLPQVVVHEINETSPLRPPSSFRSNHTGRVYSHQELTKASSSRYDQQAEISPNNQYSTPTRNRPPSAESDHIRGVEAPAYQATDYGKDDDDDDFFAEENMEQRAERNMIQAYMADRNMEVIAIIEGTDQATGGAVQARHSFIPSEIKWHHTFASCVFEDDRDGSAVIDFNMFHKLRPVSANSSFSSVMAPFPT